MRIVHLSTSSIGGAGVVAERIASMQKIDGHDVRILTVRPSLNNNHEEIISRSFRNKILSMVNTSISLIFTKPKWTQLTAISVSAQALAGLDQIKPDVVHIHNWFNLLSMSDIVSLNKRYPLVFHIHDARLMTGGCHFTLDCESYINECIKCPATHILRPFVRFSYKEIEKTFEKSFPYALIFPSNWLEKKFEESPIYKKASVLAKILAPMPVNSYIKQQFQNQEGVICVISDLSAKVKGFELFLNSVQILRSQGFIGTVRVAGANATSHQKERMRRLDIAYLGRLTNEDALTVIAKSELIIVPSFSENSPTVILEAHLLNTCTLVTSIQGNLELVEESKTGFVCELNPSSMAEGVKRALTSPHRAEIKKNAFNKTINALNTVSEDIYGTYERLLEEYWDHG